jgi:hypothetical protein
VDCWLGNIDKLTKVNLPLFEQGKKYSGVLPVFHPPQDKTKMKYFKEELERWKEKFA